MYKGKKIYVMYRALYGEQFVKESINSILDYADKVFVMHTNKPFGGLGCVEYKDELIRIPIKIDNLVERVKEIDCSKIILKSKYYKTNNNQFTIMYNSHILPYYGGCDVLIMMEVDHVFRKDQIELALDEFIDNNIRYATTEQWEIWKGFKHCVPQWNDDAVISNKTNPRYRLCTMFWNMEINNLLPITGMHCNIVESEPYRLKARTHNFGFAWSYKLQYWKYLISLGISARVNDSQPSDNWLDDKWVNWDHETNNNNLEQSIGYEHFIPKIVPYDHTKLPKSILDNLDKHIDLCHDKNIE